MKTKGFTLIELLVVIAIVDAMNGHVAIGGAIPDPMRNRNEIRNPSLRTVFLDEGQLTPSSWTVNDYRELWWDR